MKFEVRISCDDAAQAEDPGMAIPNLLVDIAQRVLNGAVSGKVRDINGNLVGDYAFKKGSIRLR